jgi:heat shock protein HtpX
MKRILLFVLTNVAVVAVLGIVASLLGVNRYLTANGLNMDALLAGFSLIMGFGGAIISLADEQANGQVVYLGHGNHQPAAQCGRGLDCRHRAQASPTRPALACLKWASYEGDPNAFATGANKNAALVAVSTGLLQNMTREEVEAVIGHEVAHIANGDMVTMTLIQGVMNTFVVFLSRVIGYAVDSFLRKGDERKHRPRHWLHDHDHRAWTSSWASCSGHRRGLVQPPPRVPCRCRCR